MSSLQVYNLSDTYFHAPFPVRQIRRMTKCLLLLLTWTYFSITLVTGTTLAWYCKGTLDVENYLTTTDTYKTSSTIIYDAHQLSTVT